MTLLLQQQKKPTNLKYQTLPWNWLQYGINTSGTKNNGDQKLNFDTKVETQFNNGTALISHMNVS